MENVESYKDEMYQLLQNPTRENFIKVVFKGLGELDNLEYKREWISEQKLSEIILGIANSGGGAIIIGVYENDNGTYDPSGIDKLEDSEKKRSKLDKFLPVNIQYSILSFDFTDESYSKIKGKLFQIIIINSDKKELPYVWKKNTNEAEEGCIFYRRGTKTVKANMQEIKEMINKRLEAEQNGKSNLELEESLKQLQTLYNFIEPTTTSSSYFSALMKNTAWIGISKLYESKNPYYPKENYDKFIANMIEKKKLQIEQILKLSL